MLVSAPTAQRMKMEQMLDQVFQESFLLQPGKGFKGFRVKGEDWNAVSNGDAAPAGSTGDATEREEEVAIEGSTLQQSNNRIFQS